MTRAPHLAIAADLDAVQKLLAEHARSTARAKDLTLPQYLTLQAIRDTQRATPALVASRARLSRSTMTSVLDRLELRGLVRRVPSSSDRRKVELQLTPSGEAVVSELADPTQSLLHARLGRLSERQHSQVARGLRLLREALETPLVESSGVG